MRNIVSHVQRHCMNLNVIVDDWYMLETLSWECYGAMGDSKKTPQDYYDQEILSSDYVVFILGENVYSGVRHELNLCCEHVLSGKKRKPQVLLFLKRSVYGGDKINSLAIPSERFTYCLFSSRYEIADNMILVLGRKLKSRLRAIKHNEPEDGHAEDDKITQAVSLLSTKMIKSRAHTHKVSFRPKSLSTKAIMSRVEKDVTTVRYDNKDGFID